MSVTHGKKANVFKWNKTAGDLSSEACTESGSQAQITDAAKRLLNPNADITFTDSGGANMLRINHASGIAYFDDTVTVVTATGTGAYVTAANLIKVGYLYDWDLSVDLGLAEKTVFQDDWKDWYPGLAGASGSAGGFFAGSNWFDDLVDTIDGTMEKFLLQLFTYDPDNDQTGDHYNAWVMFSSVNVNAPLGEMVKEKKSFAVCGMPVFVPNV